MLTNVNRCLVSMSTSIPGMIREYRNGKLDKILRFYVNFVSKISQQWGSAWINSFFEACHAYQWNVLLIYQDSGLNWWIIFVKFIILGFTGGPPLTWDLPHRAGGGRHAVRGGEERKNLLPGLLQTLSPEIPRVRRGELPADYVQGMCTAISSNSVWLEKNSKLGFNLIFFIAVDLRNRAAPSQVPS